MICKIFAIILFVVEAFVLNGAEVNSDAVGAERAIADRHHEQLVCSHRYNVDAERTSQVVLPAARSVTNSSSRNIQQRFSTFISGENHRTITNYSVFSFIHRLGNYARAVDYYLYMFCQLRL